ncbi:hypothetical protein DIPPA_08845 [Diplonema papillatum]|nr:hypothetical protein DIPPA_08845 [Diplonema papillatum]
MWTWSDGTPFWSEADGCMVGNACVWANGEPNDVNDEHYLGLWDGGTLNDHPGTAALFFFCEFPCLTDYDCPNPEGKACPYKCTPFGRCELTDPLLAAGKLEAANYADIRYWYSQSKLGNVDESESMCGVPVEHRRT